MPRYPRIRYLNAPTGLTRGQANKISQRAASAMLDAQYMAVFRNVQQSLRAGMRAQRQVAHAVRMAQIADVNWVQSQIMAAALLSSNPQLALHKLGQLTAARSATVTGTRMVDLPVHPSEYGGSRRDLRQRLEQIRISSVTIATSAVQGAIQGEIRRLSKKQREDAIRYVYGVSNALFKGNVTTAKEFKEIIAHVRANMEVVAIKSIFNFYVAEARMQTSREVYEAFISEISRIGFKMFIDDSGVIRAVKDIEKTLSSLSYWISGEAEELIYLVLANSFMEAWAGLSDDQFPSEYRTHLLMLIWKHKQMGTIKIRGKRIDNWWIAVDFKTLFGTVADLEAGYHYGAMLKSGGQVTTLPYNQQELANSVMVRYRYWYSMWMGNKMFSAAGGIGRKEHAKKMNERLVNIGHRKFSRTKRWSRYAATTQDSTLEISDKKVKYESDMAYLNKLRDYAYKHEKSESRKIDDPVGKRNWTIAMRLDFWAKRGVAPYWYFLEYGQLRFAPIIPPKGVYGRFVVRLRKELAILARNMYNKELARQTGLMVDKQGRRRQSARALPGETQITWESYKRPGKGQKITPIGEGTIPGSFLPQTAQLFKKSVTISRRNVAEAERFGRIVTGAQQKISNIEADYERFIRAAGAWGDKGTLSGATSDPRGRKLSKKETADYYSQGGPSDYMGTILAENPITFRPAPHKVPRMKRPSATSTTAAAPPTPVTPPRVAPKPLEPLNEGLKAIRRNKINRIVSPNPFTPETPQPWGTKAGQPGKLIPRRKRK